MKNLGILYLAALFCFLVYLAFTFNGTGGEGDSVHHYLYARYAFQHPELFFKHWAKPIWVLLMAPVAQLGFTAIKIAGAACTVGALYFGLLIARKISLKPDLLAVVTAVTMPFVVQLSLSGLTEPLFALWMMIGIWLFFQERDLAATAWLSFLPLVRSEGLIIICVILIYLIIRRKWSAFLLLPLGHLVIGILGYPIHKNISWVLSDIPYTEMNGVWGYGVGVWSHYFTHMYEVIGIMNAWLLAAGILFGLYRLLMYWAGRLSFKKQELWLIYGMFTAYFLAHTIFWALGIFNSAGLMRVFLAVVPLMCLIIGRLLEWILNLNSSTWFRLVFILSFIALSARFQPDMHFYKYAMQLQITQSVFKDYMDAHPELKDRTIYTELVDGAYLIEKDFFNKNKYRTTQSLLKGFTIPDDAIIFWQNRWSMTEAHMPVEKLLEHPELVLIDSMQEWDSKAYYVFEKKNRYKHQNEHELIFKEYAHDMGDCIVALNDTTRGRILSNACQFSDGLRLIVLEMPTEADSVIVKAQMHLTQSDIQPDIQLAMSYENSANKQIEWHSQPVALSGTSTKWQSISMAVPLKKNMPPDAIFKTFFWNAGTNSVLIDSLLMEWK